MTETDSCFSIISISLPMLTRFFQIDAIEPFKERGSPCLNKPRKELQTLSGVDCFAS